MNHFAAANERGDYWQKRAEKAERENELLTLALSIKDRHDAIDCTYERAKLEIRARMAEDENGSLKRRIVDLEAEVDGVRQECDGLK